MMMVLSSSHDDDNPAAPPVSSDAAPPAGRRWADFFRPGLRAHLAVLVLACALPLVGLSLATIFSFAQKQHEINRNDILATARAAAGEVDLELRDLRGDLYALALAYDPNRPREFYERSIIAASQEDPGVSIALIRPSGTVVFDTRRPPTGPPVSWDNPIDLSDAISSGRAFVSNLYLDRAENLPKIAIYVPISDDGHLDAFLVMSVPTAIFRELIREQRLPSDWTVGLSDRNRFILASTVTTRQLVGAQIPSNFTHPSGDQREVFTQSPGIGQGSIYLALVKTEIGDWIVAVGIPQAAADAPLRQSLLTFLFTGLGVLALGLGAALFIARYVSRSMRALSRAALGLVKLEPVPEMHSSVREIGEVGTALALAGERLRKNDRQLRDAQDHLARAQAIAHVGSFELDLQAGKSVWSAETYAILGLPAETVPSVAAFLSCVDDCDRARTEANIGRLNRGNDRESLDIRTRRPDGATRVVHLEIKLVRAAKDEAGVPGSQGEAVTGFIGTVHDITDRIRLEDERRELQTRLNQSQKLEALGTLAGGIAHDLNNTLVPVVALTKMVRKTLPEGSAERQDLDSVIEAADQARDLVQQILTFSRQESGHKAPIDLSVMLRQALKMFRATLPPAINLVGNIADGVRIMAEPSQLHQIVFNFVTNAAQAIGDNPGTITVSLRRTKDAASGKEKLHLAVADTGCGMDEATITRAFEPFFTTKPVGEGTGLGLSVVHGIITDLAGAVDITSEVGKGTTFDVVLPELDASAADAADEAAAA
ncbi:MAG TPA: ATP-binding protein [Stellaceae bacterium]|nr:ATP-binding protein [Stellaceae bacterium]